MIISGIFAGIAIGIACILYCLAPNPIIGAGLFSLGLLAVRIGQYDLFTDYDAIEREKKLVNSVLNIKDKYGKNAILKGLDFMPNATQRERNITIGGHKDGTSEDAKN